jgi:PAS domain S-box-containing protein
MSDTALGPSSSIYRVLSDLAPGFLWLLDEDGRVLYANQTWQEFTGVSLERLNQLGWQQFHHPDEVPEIQKQWQVATEQGNPFEMELRYRRHDGEYRWMLVRVIPQRDAVDEVGAWIGSAIDIHDLKLTQEALRQREQQLLAFSRRQVLKPQVLDLNSTVRELEPILSRALGETRGLRMHLSPALGAVRADPGQLEQVLLNLTLNSRDAMPDGGRLTIETMNVVLDERYVAGKPVETLVPGEYAALVVTDTGHGMDRATLGRIFEPFFTTKEVRQGTGLGLSTVYGIVKQSGGFIWAYSEPGLGTTFKLYFPLVAPTADAYSPELALPSARPDEIILVAEDEPMVRDIMARTLRDCGYGVLEAANGREVLEIMEAQAERVSLIVADVVMPELSGREMSARLGQRWPDIPVLFTSGYTGFDVVRRGLLEEGREFIQKPLAPEALARRVREMVDARVSVR